MPHHESPIPPNSELAWHFRHGREAYEAVALRHDFERDRAVEFRMVFIACPSELDQKAKQTKARRKF